MDILINIPETRGRPAKYNFDNFEIGEDKTFGINHRIIILQSAQRYALRRNLDWKFRTYTGKDGFTHIVRVK